MRFAIISLMPEMFSALNAGIVGRALERNLIEITHFNPRDYATDNYRTVDDKPYGGGPGMVMLAEPLLKAIAAAKDALGADARVIYLSPQGQPLTQAVVHETLETPNLILLCGRYEGIDERVIERVDAEISIGDYVLSGGELPAMVLIDSLTRRLPGSLGHAESAANDSFEQGLLEHPHYTRPAELSGEAVPDVLLGGNHADIERWRQKGALLNTWRKRPDLLEQISLDKAAKELLNEAITAYNAGLERKDMAK